MAKYICAVSSDSGFAREYEVTTSSAMECAAQFGRGEDNEYVTVYRPRSGKIVSQVHYWPNNGGYYGRVYIGPNQYFHKL